MPTKNRQPNNNGIHAYLAMKQFRSEFTFSVTCEGEKFGNYTDVSPLNLM